MCTVWSRIQTRLQLIERQRAGLVPRTQSLKVQMGRGYDLNRLQQDFFERALSAIQRRADMADETEVEGVRPWARFVTGKPGTECVSLGLHVLRVSPTGKLVASAQKRDRVTEMTVASAFGIREKTVFYRDFVANYPIWVVGEVNMLDKPAVEAILSAWRRSGFAATLFFEGDFGQLGPPSGDGDARDLPFFCSVDVWELTENMRTSDPRLTAFLGQARKACVSEAILHQFFDGLIVSNRLEAGSLAKVWAEWPDATVLTATLESAAFVNSMGFEWHDGDYLGEVQVWMGECQYGYLKLKRGMKVDVTYNLDIDSGLFNGTPGRVRGIHGCGVEIETATGVEMIWRRYEKVFNESTGR
eukprot:9504010-Pyramimonas_sp.AAC.1